MIIRWIDLSLLHAHPLNSNIMPADRYAKLREHLSRTGRYPPLIVRPRSAGQGEDEGTDTDTDTGTGTGASTATNAGYELLDGHHRARALRELGHTRARCDIWQVDDLQAQVLLATLNRLEGRDDPQRRARLLETLAGRVPDLASLTPEDDKALRALCTLASPPPLPAMPPRLADMPQAVCFFLLPDQREQLRRVLKALDPHPATALMRLVEAQGQS